jgi:hypothetical protein
MNKILTDFLYLTLFFKAEMAKKTSKAEGSVYAPLSRICSLSKRNEKGVRDFSEGFFFIIYDGEDYDPPDFIFYDGRQRRVKLIRVFSEFEFSVNLNFIPTSFFISLLPLSPQLIVQLIDLLDLFPHLGNSSSTRFPSVSNPRKVPLKKKKKKQFHPSFLFIWIRFFSYNWNDTSKSI